MASVRTMFAFYLLFAIAVIVLYSVIGITHR
jgi:hypothetical protein